MRAWHGLVVWAICTAGAVGVAGAETLRVMKTGLGEGTISGPSITCGTGGTACTNTSATGMVTLTVSAPAGSQLRAWGGDCASVAVPVPATPPPCTVDMSALRSVRADFVRTTAIPVITDFSPAGLETYLDANPTVDTPAEFLAALPQEFRENWILMSRSESLQTGTARHPRILLVSADATRIFTIGLATHSSYPGAHPNAIEYMQWNETDKNFHFHEIVLATIPGMDPISTTPPVFRFPERTRVPNAVKVDDAKCFSCHSTRNVLHDGRSTPGTTGHPPGLVPFKTRPNWDTYDSWGGMLGFNRDRIYQGSVEAAAFRRTFNLWTWQNDDAIRAVIEQLKLQPDGVPAAHRIVRWDTPALGGGVNDGHIEFDFDPPPPLAVTQEPQPTGTGPNVAYSFDRRAGATATPVLRNEVFVTLHHSCQPTSDEGRGVELFDRLTLGRPTSDPTAPTNPACPPRPASPPPGPNALRVADELATHRFVTGSVELDVRPFALAVANGCISVGGGTDVAATQTVTGLPAAAVAFFDERNGMSFNDVYDDTRRRAQSLPRRKADITRTTLDRDADLYVFDPDPFGPPPIADTADRVDGLIRQFGTGTLGIPGGSGGTDQSFTRLRQEVFRRQPSGPAHPDETVMGGVYADVENDSTNGTGDNTTPLALYRYVLEPFGVSVDKWSMGVRGRSRTYTFADIFGGYTSTIQTVLATSLGSPTGLTCTQINALITTEVTRLPAATAVPTYTDIQRIFNKACIECHDASVMYPPYRTYAASGLDLSENEEAPPGERRLWRSLDHARRIIGAPACAPGTPTCTVTTATDTSNSYLYRRITDRGVLRHPYSPGLPFTTPDDATNPDVADERCPLGLMPCEGPPLSKTDIETFRRWILGGRPNTEGDPHIQTIDGVHYDFQSAGEFVLLRGEGMELQARQTAVTTAAPVGPNAHTGLTSCVSLNTAVAMRAGLDRVTYQPEIVDVTVTDVRRAPAAKRGRLVLRINGKEVQLGPDGVALPSGGRIIRTSAPDGIEVVLPGGEAVTVTPRFWDHYQLWYMNIGVRHARSTEGVMGAIAPGSWLPALSTGASLGRQPADLAQRHRDLYETFARSWQVDAKTSLFDYEAGLSAASFVVAGWPVDPAAGCVAPPQPGGPIARAAPAPIARAEAERICADIVELPRRENCIQDVVATGEAGFAATYAATEALERRVVPAPPVLVSPADDAVVPASRVDFRWAPFPGTEGIDVVYRHCVWHADELFDFHRCTVLPGGGGAGRGSLIVKLQARFWLVVLLALLLLLVIAVLLYRRFGLRGLIFALILAAILAALLFAIHRTRIEPPRTATVTGLVPGKVYFWKVIAETTQGITVESHTQRLEVTR